MDLFDQNAEKEKDKNAPLPYRMSPRNLSEFVGQDHILGKDKLLTRAIQADRISSLILWGPPGTGKTALAKVIANTTNAYFESMNAVTARIEDIRKAITDAEQRRKFHKQKTLLFVDEIHRFNKVQQDALLPAVEDGTIILIGATTHNPYFSVVSALVSRSQIFQLQPLKHNNLKTLLENALQDKERGLGNYKVKMDPKALDHLVHMADGDARKALSALEVGVLTTRPKKASLIEFDLKVAEESIQKKAIVYDNEDQHYDTISAFIKSMRGSDPDAALYWLAKMIYAGEDPRFIGRRIVICAAEDVGNADPLALVIANAAMEVAEFVGLPEARIPLAQAVIYVATAPKSNSAITGIDNALADVENNPTQEVPLHLRDANYPGAKKLGHGKEYKYAHSYQGGYTPQEYMPTKKKYYNPTDRGFEAKIKKRMDDLAKLVQSEEK